MGERLSAFSRRLELLVAAQAPRRVVLDMRYNGGGDNTTYGPLLGLLQRNQAFNQPGRLYVLIGRQTFSAATNFVTELERSVAPIFVGEPTGGSRIYGDTRPQTLPHSQLVVLISARYWQKSTPGDQRPAIELSWPCRWPFGRLLRRARSGAGSRARRPALTLVAAIFTLLTCTLQ